MSGGALTAVEFQGDTLFVVDQGERQFVPLKPVASALGLSWAGQQQRVRRDPVLSQGVCVMHIPSAGGAQKALCLCLRLLPHFLSTIDTNRVAPELRPKLIAYQTECAHTLARRFIDKEAPRGLTDGEVSRIADLVVQRLERRRRADPNDRFEAFDRRNRQIGRGLDLRERSKGGGLAELVAQLPVWDSGRRPSWWGDLQVRTFLTDTYRQTTLDQAVREATLLFGTARAPSRSAISRYWQRLDVVVVAHCSVPAPRRLQ